MQMLLSAIFSDVLGYTSIACWLGAQFPQVLENARRQSVEGLALPFLLNWLMGDATNLIGCILTRQLPFQTYLATYFCFVDCSLLAQYYYYQSHADKTTRSHLHSRERTATGPLPSRRLSVERGASAPHYRALSTVASNVAAVAALAAQQEEQTHWHGRRSHSIEPSSTAYDDEDMTEDPLARLTASFHSEDGRSESTRRKVAWGQDSYTGRSGTRGRSRQSSRVLTTLQMTQPLEGSLESLARGRSLARAVDQVEGEEEWLSASTQRRGSRASRKGATMVFLGVWALFGFNMLTGSKSLSDPASLIQRTGKVLARADVLTNVPTPAPLDNLPGAIDEAFLAQLTGVFTFEADERFSDHPEPGPTMEHTIGRISAWICTTLYLTSRLPQIWKNYVRKSVEGLSMYLFIFAFLGNFFYVASILTSPNLHQSEPRASAFIRESIPYLLGSGGTLMFDITIVTQSLIYRPKGSARDRRQSRILNEEEAGFLSAGATGAEESPAASRRRGGSVSRDRPLA